MMMLALTPRTLKGMYQLSGRTSGCGTALESAGSPICYSVSLTVSKVYDMIFKKTAGAVSIVTFCVGALF